MRVTALVTAAIATAIAFSFRQSLAGSRAMWLGLAVPYLILSVYALYRMYDDGTLLDVFVIRAGDVTVGVFTAALALGGAWLFERFLLGAAAPRLVWLLRISLEFGTLQPSPAKLAMVIVGFAVAEELVWRGLVLSAIAERFGTRRAWPLAALAYAVAHVPSIFTLADPELGMNPLLAVAALGCGLLWSFTMSLVGRLPPLIISHAVFSYFAVAMLLPKFG